MSGATAALLTGTKAGTTALLTGADAVGTTALPVGDLAATAGGPVPTAVVPAAHDGRTRMVRAAPPTVDDDLDDDDLPAWEVMADVIRDETGMFREGPEVGS